MIKFNPTEITENEGPVTWVHMATCPCVAGESFRVYQVIGQNHFHVECVDCGIAYCPFEICQLSTKTTKLGVHEHEGRWYFWDETGFHRHGPYPNEYTAHIEYRRYAHWRNSGEDFPAG